MALQKGNKILIQLEIEAAKVNSSTAGEAVVVDYITISGAVEVNYSATGRQQGIDLAAGGSSKILVNCGQSSNG